MKQFQINKHWSIIQNLILCNNYNLSNKTVISAAQIVKVTDLYLVFFTFSYMLHKEQVKE